ncbi:hypothetical protein Tsubulata_031390 [Turnera subulata]|uniref:RRM domain-containing protein n=1 Tax=Turnera subulata TaxID=218843 RepID=A0A9Q0J060_9ROSI|nr:hypothetical protein Tsubulata_031390 [Turnera subulata]
MLSLGKLRQEGSSSGEQCQEGRFRASPWFSKPSFFSRWPREIVQRALDNQSTVSIFVENILAGWFASDVYKDMSKVGIVLDVFMPGKLTWDGFRYGFVRFDFSGTSREMVEKINTSKSLNGMFRTKVATNRWRASGSRRDKVEVASSSNHSEEGYRNTDASFAFNPSGSCLNILKNCAFGEVKKGVGMQDVIKLFKVITNSMFDVKMLGGNYVLMVFESHEAFSMCLKHKDAWKGECFEFLKEWEIGDCATQRECCLNIHGVPSYVWCDEFFKQISICFGKFIKSINPLESSNYLDVARIQIMTTYRDHITRSFKVLVGWISKGGETQGSLDPFGIMDTIRYLEKGKGVMGEEAAEKNKPCGDSSTQDCDIELVNKRVLAATTSMASSKSVKVGKTLEVGRALGLEIVGDVGEVERVIEELVEKEGTEWVDS